MLIGGIAAVVVVVGLVAVVLVRRRSHDDEHSVEHYHRSLHTLEGIRTHPRAGEQNGNGGAYPASAFRASGSSAVRLTEPGPLVVPPVPPPPVANPSEPVRFDDAEAGTEPEPEPGPGPGPGPGEASGPGSGPGNASGKGRDEAEGPESVPATFMTGRGDRAIHSINRRPRRLGAPLAAVAAVAVLVVVLILTGMHTNTPAHHGSTSGSTATTAVHTHHAAGGGHPSTTTTTTTTAPPPVVSAPSAITAHGATYQVAAASYTLAVAATNADCWVQATTPGGSVLFSGTLFSGQSHAIAATGPLTVIAGAPGAFSATVDGAAVTLPGGSQAPFTLTFQTAAGSA